MKDSPEATLKGSKESTPADFQEITPKDSPEITPKASPEKTPKSSPEPQSYPFYIKTIQVDTRETFTATIRSNKKLTVVPKSCPGLCCKIA